MRRPQFLAALVISSCLLGTVPFLTSCSSNPQSDNRTTDQRITDTVKKKLASDSEVRSFAIDVRTDQGVVYLSGRVAEPAQKQEATDIAKDTPGVADVVNNIKVGAS